MEDNSEIINHLNTSSDDVVVVNVIKRSDSSKKKKKKKGKKKKHHEKLLAKLSAKASKKLHKKNHIKDARDDSEAENNHYDSDGPGSDHNRSSSQNRRTRYDDDSDHSPDVSPVNVARTARGDSKSSSTPHPRRRENHDPSCSPIRSPQSASIEVPYPAHSKEEVDYLLLRVDYLTSKVEALSKENQRLNDQLYNYEYNCSTVSEGDIGIIFKKKELNKKFSGALKLIISCLINGLISTAELEEFCSRFKDKKTSPEPDSLFSLDCSAEPDISVPRYDSSFREILQKTNETDSESPLRTGRFQLDCFNCGEDHHLNICPYPLDYQRIAFAKRQKQRSYFVSKRYHVQGKNENNFKPGVISDELRDALNIGDDQIPSYVYRMRVVDYPPGWLLDAEVESSGITLYDSEGKAEKSNADDNKTDPIGAKVQYDPEKLIDYPGFNVPLPPNYIDESYKLGLPALQTHQLRSFREKNMEKPVTVPSRKRPSSFKDDKPQKIQRVEEDMEIEDQISSDDSVSFIREFVPPLPESTPPPPPPPPPPPEEEGTLPVPPPDVIIEETVVSNPSPDACLSAFDLEKIKSCSNIDAGSLSPSLAELEELKNKIRMQLELGMEEEASCNPSIGEDSCSVLEEVTSSSEKTSEESYVVEEEFIASENSGLSSISDSSSLLNKSVDSPAAALDKTADSPAAVLGKTADSPSAVLDKTADSPAAVLVKTADSPTSVLDLTADSPAASPGPLKRTESKSKLVSLGTPSMSKHSSFSKLPDYDNFSKNVSSHMPFENLPNSTGTYTKLKNVLKKVKVTLNNLMQ